MTTETQMDRILAASKALDAIVAALSTKNVQALFDCPETEELAAALDQIHTAALTRFAAAMDEKYAELEAAREVELAAEDAA